MKAFTVWLKQPAVVLYIGGDPTKGTAPVITATVEKPQILVDPEKHTITIIETKQEVAMGKDNKKPPIRRVAKLPKVAVLDEVIFNKGDGCFYLGVETKKEVKKHGSRMEEAGI